MLSALLAGLAWTLGLAALSFLAGAVLGLGLCALRLSRRPPLRLLAGLVILVLRAVPPLLWLLLAVVGSGATGLPLGPFAAAVLALALVAAAGMAEIYRRALASVEAGQGDAATVLGLPPRSRFRDVLAPQLLRAALPPAAGLAAALLRDSAIASLVGAGGIAAEAARAAGTGSAPLATFAAAGALYLALGLAVTVAARGAALRLRAGAAR